MSGDVPVTCGSPNIDAIWQSLDAFGGDRVASSTPNGPATETRPSRRKSRKSWFDKPPTKYEIAVEKKRRSKGRKSDVEDEVLTLTHFTKPPKIGFGILKPGQNKVRNLLIRNPHEYEQTVKVEKFPHKKNFSVDMLEFTVGAKETLHFEITWNPEEEGNFREMILFVVDNSYRLQSFVFGSVEAPPKKKVIKRKGLLGSKVQKPFSILHTQSLANIKKSYSPQKEDKKITSGGKPIKDNKNTSSGKTQPGIKKDSTGKIQPEIKRDITGKTRPISDENNMSIGTVETPEFLEINNENDPKSERRKSHRRSSTYVKMPDLGMSPIGFPPGTGKKTNVNDILHSTVRSDVASDASPQNIVESDKENSPACLPPKTPDDKKLEAVQVLTQGLVSPNSFLQDSLCQQNDEVKTGQASDNGFEGKDQPFEQKNFLSPDTFLKNLGSKVDKDVVKCPLSNIPSPEAVLNRSIPHEIVIQQLGNVQAQLEKKMPVHNNWKSGAIKSKKALQIAQSNDRRETFVKSKSNRRTSRSGSTRGSTTANTRRETFEKHCMKANPFVEVPTEITSSPRRTTYTVKQTKPNNKTKQKTVKSHGVKKNENGYKRIETDVVTTETVLGKNTEIVSTTKHTEVVETYTCSFIEEEVIPTPERSLACNQQKKTTTKTEISKVVDSNTVTKNRTIPTPERSQCGKQLFSPRTGQKVHTSSGDSSFGSPRRLPNSPLAAVINKRSSMTVTKDKPSDVLVEQTEKRLSTCLFGDKKDKGNDMEEDSLEDKQLVFAIKEDSLEDKKTVSAIKEEDSLEDKKSVFAIKEEDSLEDKKSVFAIKEEDSLEDKITVSVIMEKEENCFTPTANKTTCQNIVMDTTMREAKITTENSITDTPTRDARLHNSKFLPNKTNFDTSSIDTPMRESGIMTGKFSTNCTNVAKMNQSIEDMCLLQTDSLKTYKELKGAYESNSSVSCERSFKVTHHTDDQFCKEPASSNDLDTPMREMLPSLKTVDVKAMQIQKNNNDTSSHMIDTPLRNLENFNMTNGTDIDNAKPKRRSFWGKPCDLSTTFDNVDTPMKNLVYENDAEKKESKRKSFWEKVEEGKVVTPLIVNDDNDSSITCNVTPCGHQAQEEEKNPSFPTTPYHMLPQRPNPENSRRSTHVVENPKVLNLNETQKKKLFADQEIQECVVKDEASLIEKSQSCNETKGFDIKIENPELSQDEKTVCISSEKEITENKLNLDHITNEIFTLVKDKQTEKSSEETVDASGLFFVSCSPVKTVEKPAITTLTKPLRKQPIRSTVTNQKKTSPKRPLNHGKMSENKRRRINEDLQGKTDLKQRSEVLMKPETEQGKKHQQPSKQNKLSSRPNNKGSAAVQGRVKSLAKGVAQSKLMLVKKTKTALPKHPLPFAAKNMYYDERWMQKQERGFVHWLNFVLTPPDEYQQTTKIKVDAGKISMDNVKSSVKLAPTREVLSFRAYSERRRLNQLRRAACKLFQSKEVVHVVQKVEVEVESDRLYVRKDRKVHADLGLKQAILDMLLSFNPLWLRIGLETTFGELIMIQNNGDVIGLSRFIITRILGNPDIACEFSHPSVPHLYRDGYAVAIARHLLKKFLILVYFLDHAKSCRLVPQDPCLFCKDAEYKTCKAMLIDFSKDYLAGEGDITRHLGYLGYQIKHQQTAMDEFDYAVTNLATDLKDGIRLARVMEILSEGDSLTKRLRAPAISRLQKIHNMDVVFEILGKQGITIDQNGSKVTSRDVVDGHREKTLKLLWALIVQYQVGLLLNKEQLKEEIRILERSLKVKNQLAALQRYEYFLSQKKRDSIDPDLFSQNELIFLLMKWCRVVCAFYDIKVENFTVSFGDGRVLCHLIHHYHPALLPREIIKLQTSTTLTEDMEQSNDPNDSLNGSFNHAPYSGEGDAELFENMLVNEKENFKTLYEKVSELGGIPLMLRSADMSNTIPDEKVVVTYVTYLCARLLDIRHESRAARVIQLAWRRHHLQKVQKDFHVKQEAVIVIQRFVRKCLQQRHQQRQGKAALVVQTTWRGFSARNQLRQMKWTRDNERKIKAAIVIKRYLLACRDRRRYQQKLKAIVTIQAEVRSHICRQKFLRVVKATRFIQSKYRAFKEMAKCRSEYQSQQQSCVKIQKWWKMVLEMKKLQKDKAVIVIQAVFKGFMAKKKYDCTRNKVMKLQAAIRTYLTRKSYLQQRNAALTIQAWYRSHLVVAKCRSLLKKQRLAVIYIQSCFRRHICLIKYKKMKSAAIIIQTQVRTYLAMKELKQKRMAAVKIQNKYKARLLMKQDRKKFQHAKTAAITLQSAWRGVMVRKMISKMHMAATIIQARVRTYIAMKKFKQKKFAAVIMQRHYKARLLMKQDMINFQHMKTAAITIQSAFRGHFVRKMVTRMHIAAVIIQTKFRGQMARDYYLCLRELTITCQRKWRLVLKERQEKELLHKQTQAVTVIQAVYRGCIERRKYSKVKSSAIIIQSYVKSSQQRKKYLKLKAGSLVLQRHYRAVRLAKKQRSEYLLKKNAAVTIQCSFRGFIARYMLKLQNKAATKIQACYKAYKQRKFYKSLKTATSIIQTKWRAFVSGRETLREFLLMKGAAITLQAFFRGFAVRKMFRQLNVNATKLQACYRRYRQRKTYLKVKNAVLKCQTMYRAKVACNQQRQKYLEIKTAALTIQRAYRQYRITKEKMKLHHAAVSIQSCYRCHVERQKYCKLKEAVIKCQRAFRNKVLAKNCRHSYLHKRVAIVTIQSGIRGWHVRENLKRKQSAATKIQSCYKAFVIRKRFNLMKYAAMTIQRHHRANALMCITRHEYLIKKGATITIQAAVKGWKVRKEICKHHRAATKIQSAFRGHRQLKHFRVLQKAVVSCQRIYRNCLVGAKTRKLFLCKQKSVVTLQATFRGWVVRKELRKKQKAATIIQSVFRGHKVNKRYLNLKHAVITCQRRLRASVLAKHMRRQYLIQKGAALTIEDWYCACKQRRNERLQIRAASIIQRYYRACNVRKTFVSQRQAVLTIQRQYRAFKCMKMEQHQYLLTKTAVAVIQKHVRGHLARTQYVKDKNCVVKVQSAIRTYLQRRHYARLRSAASVCQKRYRETKLSKHERQDFLKKRSAVVMIQSHFREYKKQKLCRLKENSAIIIQKHYRRYQACKQFSSVKSAVQTIQTHWRATLLKRQEHAMFMVKKGAAITIQAWWKGQKVRKHYTRMYKTVKSLQRYVRTKQQRKQYLVRRSSAIVIQSHLRSYLKGREVRINYLRMKESVIKIQALIRSYKARKLLKQIKACTLIQSHIRRYICQEKYNQLQEATVTIQSYYRGLQERRNFQKKLLAVVKIQKCVKRRSFANRVKNYLEERRKSAIKIQNLYRGHRARKQVKKIRAAILIQSLMRMHLARQEFVACIKKVIMVQCCVRRYLALKTCQKLRRKGSAATCIQRCYRLYKERQLLEQQRQVRLVYLRRVCRVTWLNLAAIVVQRCYRRYRLMQQARERLGKLIIIQRWIRGRLHRLKYLRFQRALVIVQRQARCYLQRRQHAALTIQKSVKQWLVVRKQKLKIKAIVRIQAIWRGEQVRRKSIGKKIEKIRKRVEEANRSATEEKKLGNRMASALDYLLKFKQLSHILEVLIHLDVATRLSPACCERFVSVNAVQVIYRLMRGCNRSQPHMDLIKYSVSILLNLAKYDKTVYEVYNVEGSVDTLIELMQIYREKGAIFNSTCMLLGILGMLDRCRMDVRGDKKLSEKLRSIHCLTARKHKIDESRQLRQARLLAAKSFNSSLPVHLPQKKQHKIRPDWVLHKDKMKEIQDPLTAVNFVMDSFQLKPK